MKTYAIYDVVEKQFVKDHRWQHFGHALDWLLIGQTIRLRQNRMRINAICSTNIGT